MKVTTAIAIVAGIVIPLQLTSVGYLVRVESRLTRMETIIDREVKTPPRSDGRPAINERRA